MSVTFLLGFPFDPSREVMMEQDLWQMIPKQLDDEMLDIGMPKPQGEVLVYGNYYAPGEKPVTADTVRLTVGTIDKKISVIGNRYWRTLLTPTAPEPFKYLPLRYNYAFGGSKYARNPLGKGLDEVDVLGEMRLPMPNIEDPDRLITSTDDRPLPAGFSSYNPSWEQRVKMMGTYDENWKNNHFPDYAPDLDWRHFNAAPADQWISDFWHGNESFSLENMHQTQTLQTGKLPGFRARCFVERQSTDAALISEVKMQAETVCFFPDVETGVMIFRGTIDIEQDDGSDIEHLLAAFETLDEPAKDRDYYEHQLRDRQDEKNTFKYMMTTRDLIPSSVRCGFSQLLDGVSQSGENELIKNVETRAENEKNNALVLRDEKILQLKQKLLDAGIDPAPYIEKLKNDGAAEINDPQMKMLIDTMEKVLPGCTKGDGKNIDIEAFDFSALADLSKQTDVIAATKKQQAVDQLRKIADAADDNEAGQKVKDKINAAIQQMDEPNPLPRPQFEEFVTSIRHQLEQADQARQLLIQQGFDETSIPKPDFDINQIEEQVKKSAEGMRQAYRIGAHYIEGKPPHTVPLDIVKHRFSNAIERRQSLVGGDYSGVDFSGMDLSGIDFSDCYLEYANFTDACLRGANLKRAILTHSNLTNADFSNTDLHEANLGGSHLSGAIFEQSNLKDAVLSKAECSGAIFIDCDMNNVNFLEAGMTGVKFHKCRTKSANFIEIDFTGADFIECEFLECNFVKCTLKDGDFSNANLSNSNFVECILDGSKFISAQLTNIRLPGGTTARYCNFDKSVLDKSNFRDVDAEGSSFEEATFHMADFSSANLQKSRFYAASGKRALMVKADLFEADLMSMNLMEGSLMKARLTNANLSYANLYSVEFMGAIVGGTDFLNANLDMTIMEDWRPSL